MSLTARLVSVALVPFACGFFLSYLLRSVNAVVGPNLVSEFNLGPEHLGLLTAAYLLAFAMFQLPLGVLLDRYGARRVQSVLLSIAGIGCVAFAFAPNYAMLVAARAVIGLGFSAGLMASYKSNEDWMPPERRTFVAMAIMSTGAFGVVVATEPSAILVQEIGWRTTFLVFSVVVFAVAVLIYLVVPEKPAKAAALPMVEQWHEMVGIMKLPLFHRVAPMLALTAGIPIALQTLWAGPWFHDVMKLPQDEVARQLLWMAIAFMIGVFTMGFIADRMQRAGISPIRTMLTFMTVHVVAHVLIATQVKETALAAWVALAAVGQCANLAFPWFASQVGNHRAGKANATINFSMFVAAFVIQYGMGIVLGFYSIAPGTADPAGYALASVILVTLHIASIIWYVAAPRTIGASE